MSRAVSPCAARVYYLGRVARCWTSAPRANYLLRKWLPWESLKILPATICSANQNFRSKLASCDRSAA